MTPFDKFLNECRPTGKLKRRHKNKSFAIVGNAESIKGTGQGEDIDGQDIVIRINNGWDITGEDMADVGSRTDIVYSCGAVNSKLHMAAQNNRYWTAALYSANLRLCEIMREWYFLSGYVTRRIRPSTGTLAILEALCCDPSSVYVCGFDFFDSRNRYEMTHQGRYRAVPMRDFYHDFEQDRLFLARMFQTFDRIFTIDKVLQECISLNE